MLFNSYIFLLVFLPIVLAGFIAMQDKNRGIPTKFWLLAASLFFYAWWNPPYIALLLASILVNFWIGGAIISAAKQGLERRAHHWLIAGVTANLLLLGYYKYSDFFVRNVEAVTGQGFQLEPVFLPLAISFFTFQQIAYLVDASRGRVEGHNLVNYALFVSFFPQLIAGPIVHHSQMIPQFQAGRFHFTQRNFAEGIAFLTIGLIKKVLIADTLGLISDPVFNTASATPPGALESWIGVMAFTLGIYFDFSGYSDMAVGLARMMGIRLPYNFASPYKSASIVEFWRRWHITLSEFLRDYVYIPLGGNRLGKARRYINLMLTMLLGGLWHGAGWTFVLWGALHGAYLAINHGWRELGKRGLLGSFVLGRQASAAITLGAVMLAWVFFRADSFAEATAILSGMIGLNGFSGMADYVTRSGDPSLHVYTDPDTIYGLCLMGLATWIVLAAPNSQEIIDDVPGSRPVIAGPVFAGRPVRWRADWRWAGALACAFVLSLTQMSRVQEFIYFQF